MVHFASTLSFAVNSQIHSLGRDTASQTSVSNKISNLKLHFLPNTKCLGLSKPPQLGLNIDLCSAVISNCHLGTFEWRLRPTPMYTISDRAWGTSGFARHWGYTAFITKCAMHTYYTLVITRLSRDPHFWPWWLLHSLLAFHIMSWWDKTLMNS